MSKDKFYDAFRKFKFIVDIIHKILKNVVFWFVRVKRKGLNTLLWTWFREIYSSLTLRERSWFYSSWSVRKKCRGMLFPFPRGKMIYSVNAIIFPKNEMKKLREKKSILYITKNPRIKRECRKKYFLNFFSPTKKVGENKEKGQ